ncbi:HCLS1-binding protein 3 isoform X3 [Chlorocebus sabaeus]|uniref:HCLS1-binding protein 3 isoform X3 n=1 Tax=Chlorocebus sabaeus TaxID=60711 RepID=UPI003BF958EE
MVLAALVLVESLCALAGLSHGSPRRRVEPSLCTQALGLGFRNRCPCLALKLSLVTTSLQASLVPISPWGAAAGTWLPPKRRPPSIHPDSPSCSGTRSPGAAGLTSRDSSVLDGTDSQTGNDEEAFDFFEQQDQVAEEGPPIQGLKGEDAEESLEEEEALDPLGIMRSKKPKKHPKVAMKAKPTPRLTIFDEEVDPDQGLFGPGRKQFPQGPSEDVSSMDPLKLFDDPDLGGAVPLGDSLLLPAACESGGPTPSLSHRDASKELFRVEEDLDQILNLGAKPKPKPQPKPKPPVAAKPAIPRKPAVPHKAGLAEAVAGQQKPQEQIQAMDEMDILQYIRDHDTPAQAAPSLF